MNRYVLTVPYEFQRNGKTETRFRRVGAIFENARRETGEVFLSVKLDFPGAVTELVAFPPCPRRRRDRRREALTGWRAANRPPAVRQSGKRRRSP